MTIITVCCSLVVFGLSSTVAIIVVAFVAFVANAVVMVDIGSPGHEQPVQSHPPFDNWLHVLPLMYQRLSHEKPSHVCGQVVVVVVLVLLLSVQAFDVIDADDPVNISVLLACEETQAGPQRP